MIKFGVSIYSISRKIMKGEISPHEGVRWLCENGAEVIELVPFGIDIVNNKGLAAELRKEAEQGGVKIENYSLNANFLQITAEEREAEFRRIESHIDAAEDLGVSTVRVDASGYRRKPEDNTLENYIADLPIVTDVYGRLCGYAKKKGFTVLLENHGFHLNGADRVETLIKSVKCDNFSHQLDVGNFVCVDDNPVNAVKKLIGYAKTIHMKDFYIRNEDNDPGDSTQFDCSGSWFRSQNGAYLRGSILKQGDIDIKKIASIIKGSGFDGNIYVEFEGIEDCCYGTKVSLDNLKAMFA